MRTDDFDFALPEELIAQTPVPRGQSRLLVLHRDSGRREFRDFTDLPRYLHPGDVLVVNDSRVTARRLAAMRENGLAAEALLLRPRGETGWEALLKPGRRVRAGSRLRLALRDGGWIDAEVGEPLPGGTRVLQFSDQASRDRLATEGSAPLPPYIRQPIEDEERYQTVYAGPGGSAAAPTAGLHFTPEMLAEMEERGIAIAPITLHIGIDTFRPIRTDMIEDHVMHGETFTLPEPSAATIRAARGRVIAVGTTAVRALESSADKDGHIKPGTRETRLFIAPGYRFRVVEGLLTNFHLPKSSLVVLVSAFAGRDAVLATYRAAIEARFRFFSFGDAMLIL